MHRFPGSMARRVQDLAAFVVEEYDGDAPRIWTDARDGADLRARLAALPGFGDMKVRSVSAVLAKRFGVAAAQEIAPDHRTLGDVDSPAGAPRLPGREAGPQGRAARESRPIEITTLTDGGQPAEQIAHALAGFIAAAAEHARDRDLRHPPAGPARRRSSVAPSRTPWAVASTIRLAYNVDYPDKPPVPPPPQTDPTLIESLPFPTAAIPGVPDLMHHKYVIRDAEALWTGSMNWTADSWTREENVIVTVESPELAARYGVDFEQLWSKRDVQKSGQGRHVALLDVAGQPVRPWFCPGRGDKLAHRIAKAIGTATRRIRIASPVISSGPILGTLAQVATDGKVDLAGVVDSTQIHEVLRQWHLNGNAAWKEPLLQPSLTRAPFTGKHSTPYGPGTVHDFMHAKVTVADDIVFVGSFNLSHSGELERRERARNRRSRCSPTASQRSSTTFARGTRESIYRRPLEVGRRAVAHETDALCVSAAAASSYDFLTGPHARFIRPAPILCPSDKTSARYKSIKGDTNMRNSLKALMKRKTLFAFVLALTIFGAVYGFAATLNLSTNQLSAGNATVASCQSTTPVASYAPAYDATLGGYKVGTITVTSLDAGVRVEGDLGHAHRCGRRQPGHDHRRCSCRRRRSDAHARRDDLGGLGHRHLRRSQRLTPKTPYRRTSCGRDTWRRVSRPAIPPHLSRK